MRALPGVAHAGVSAIAPVSGAGWNERCEIVGTAPLDDREQGAWLNAVSPGWFATYGTPLVEGPHSSMWAGTDADAA